MTSAVRLAAAAAVSLCALSGLGLVGYAVGSAPAPVAATHPSPVRSPSPRVSPSPRPSPSRPPATRSATAPYRYAETPSDRAGTGVLRRYQVAVETGVRVEPAAFAAAVEETLRDGRGWTKTGRWSFQRVTPGAAADLVIRLATPATVDRVCRTAGLETLGKVSCRAGQYVMINLTRWRDGIPAYADHIRDYQHLVINHEVGHFLGFGHVGCPAKGAPAPAMMPQYFGLNGCVPNAWPYPTPA